MRKRNCGPRFPELLYAVLLLTAVIAGCTRGGELGRDRERDDKRAVPSSAPTGPSGVSGVLTAGATAAVPVAGTVEVWSHDERRATGNAGADGRFEIPVEPGEYELRAVVGGRARLCWLSSSRARPVVTVTEGFTQVALFCESLS
ncbi:MAG: hypothetical protein KY429_00820 [Actinobacteria bacterium]|nr:hypothetical protein [Actinomycetota bacterium]